MLPRWFWLRPFSGLWGANRPRDRQHLVPDALVCFVLQLLCHSSSLRSLALPGPRFYGQEVVAKSMFGEFIEGSSGTLLALPGPRAGGFGGPRCVCCSTSALAR